MNLPLDPMMLLSVVNMYLRDTDPSFDAFIDRTGANREDILKKMASIDYVYDPDRNQFV